MQQRSTYHHGNLRAELIRCGRKILAEEGIQNLTWRYVTRAAGVSHGAPRNEFGDLNGLLAAMAAEGFEELVALRERALARSSDPAARLRAILACYIDFAKENPDLFWLMYGPHIVDRQLHADLSAASRRSYAILEACVFEYLTSLGFEHACTAELVHCAWSGVHGMSMLFNGRRLGTNVQAAVPFAAWKNAVIDFVLSGLSSRAQELPKPGARTRQARA